MYMFILGNMKNFEVFPWFIALNINMIVSKTEKKILKGKG